MFIWDGINKNRETNSFDFFYYMFSAELIS
jgi:hypothetical protein